MEGALKDFGVKVDGKIALDVGASTGGFTDCLLQAGARQVYTVDVSYGPLAWKLRKDPRVVVIERTNARYLTREILQKKSGESEWPALAVIDVSFISLAKILPAVFQVLTEEGEVVALVKPQFEARREQVERGGIVSDPKVHQEVVEKVKKEAIALGFIEKGITKSPIEGADGNVEYFIYLTKK